MGAVFKQSSTILIVSTVANLFAGVALGLMDKLYPLLPGLLLIVPAIVGLGGRIFGCLAARLGTGLHSGEIKSDLRKSPKLNANLLVSLIQNLFIAYLLAVLASLFGIVLGWSTITFQDFLFIAITASLISGTVLTVATPLVTILGFRKGLDPDNFSIPSVTAIGDISGLLALFFIAHELVTLKEFEPELAGYVVNIAFLVITLVLISGLLALRSKEICRGIIVQMAPILIISTFIPILSGAFLEANVATLIEVAAFLILIPPLVANGGNLGGIFSARLSTAVILGEVDKAGGLTSRARRELGLITGLALLTFPIVGIVTHVLAVLMGRTSPGLFIISGISLLVGLLLLPIVGAIAYILIKMSYRTGVDPDNVVIPMMTSLIDLCGIGLLMVVIVSLERLALI